MAASAMLNPQVKSESKSARKKKAKGAPADSPASMAAAPEPTPSTGAAESNNGNGSYESPYIKELHKSIRNVNKKITNASKVDNVIAENPDKTLDELVAARKINADQKAQILKKPVLQASLIQLEEQVAQYTKFDSEFKAQSQAEKASFEKLLTERANKELAEAVASAKAEAQVTAVKGLEDSLLLLSQFLKLAAIRRAEEEAADLEESKALEGLLAQVYSGDATAVAAMLNLINGSDENLKSVNGEDLKVSYADLKAASLAQVSYVDPVDVEETISTSENVDQIDSTDAQASPTEIHDVSTPELTNGHAHTHSAETPDIPQNSGLDEGTASTVAEVNWDANNDMSQSQEWVEIPRDASENENTSITTTAPPSKVQSWADDQPDSPSESASAPPNAVNDGFQEIQRNRGGRGHSRGHRGPRGDGHRGRGSFRGDGYRGRGRGGGGNRGGRRSDES